LKQRFATVYLSKGIDEREYVIQNAVFLIAQYLYTSEIARRQVNLVELSWADSKKSFVAIQDTIASLWRTDQWSSFLRIFAGEQRAVGEALVEQGPDGPVCMGYGAFLNAFPPGKDRLLGKLRADVASLNRDLPQAEARLTCVHGALIDLLALLESTGIQFPPEKLSKL